MIVVDASAILELLVNSERAGRVAARLFDGGESLHAPHLLDLEVLQVLRRYEATGALDAARAAEALEDLAALPLRRYPHDVFAARIWELRRNVTAYDAVYLALAESLGATFVTCDRALGRVRNLSTGVEVL